MSLNYINADSCKQVLLIENDDHTAELITSLLSDYKCHTERLPEAEALTKYQETIYDYVLCGYQHPNGITGFDIIKKLQDIRKNGDKKILIGADQDAIATAEFFNIPVARKNCFFIDLLKIIKTE